MFNKKTRHFLCSALALSMSAAVLLTGCGPKTPANSSSKVDNSKKVTLKYYFRAPQVPSDLQTVNDAMNKILEKKINADIQLVCVANTDYLTKLDTMINAQEDFDLAFTSTSASYTSQAQKGAYKDLTKLLPTYAPKTWALYKSDIWNAAKVGGKIYASINQQIFARQSGFTFNKAYVDKYNFDITKVQHWSDLTPLFDKVKAGEPADKTSALSYGFGATFNVGLYYAWKYETVGTNSLLPGMVQSDAKTLKVFNQYDDSKFKTELQTIGDWFVKGYIPKDILTRTNFDNSLMPATVTGTIKPGGESDEATQFSWKAAVHQAVGDAYIPNGALTGTMTSVSATSKNPERAVQYIELINTDKELYNLLAHGVEGVHYTKTGDNVYTPVDNTKYKPNMDWEFGNTFNDLLTPSQASDVWAQTKKLNDSAYVSPVNGFVFDDSSVKTEEANCLAIVKQYAMALGEGTYGANTMSKLAEMNAALKSAGMDTLIKAEQDQLDTFMAAKKK